MKKNESVIVIGDVHGRTFWREALEKFPEDDVIFLGDYVDPYPSEGITREDTIKVLQEIIEAKKREPNRITLLLGNHDLMYISSDHNKIVCRHDYENEPRIMRLLWEPELFKLVDSREIGEKKYVFSHAGIHNAWLDRHKEFGDKLEDVLSNMNKALWDVFGDRDNLMETLLEISVWRSGSYEVGSPVWADVREYERNESLGDNVYQIFGHTQLKRGMFIESDHFACVDCKRAFRITEKGINPV